ncbi:MAG: tetratricopeptide repeat protein [Lentisphaeria bacterium]|nr:tetratricopeptide repeat protein [Lentisphaeria bacterium]
MNRWCFSAVAAVVLTGQFVSVGADPAPVVPAASPVTAAAPVSEPVDPDLRSGDYAFAQKDYPVAVSFYTKYLRTAEKRKDREMMRTAYVRLLDALVMGRIPALAEEYLKQYEQRFPQGYSDEIAIWRCDILYQQKKYAEALALARKLLRSMTAQDPRRLRTAFVCGQVLEQLGRWKEAVAQYDPLRREAAGTLLGRRSFVRQILCLASDRQFDRAWNLLLDDPPKTSQDKEIAPLLAAYVTLKQSGPEAASGAWSGLVRQYRNSRLPLVYLVASAYGDAFVRVGDLPLALASYRAAFQAASDKNEMLETLNRMVAVISRTGDRMYAAKLAASQLDLFRDSLLSPEIKLRTARLLQDAGNEAGALTLYESVFSNMNSSDAERKQAVCEYALLKGRSGRIAEAEKTVHDCFRAERAMEGEFLMAEILVRLEKPEQYIRKYESIASRWPEQAARAYQEAAAACLDARLADQTLKFLEKLRKLPSGRPDSVSRMTYLEAAARAQKGQSKEALQLYQEFLKLAKQNDPLVPKALYHSGLLAFSLQELKLAAECFSRFRKDYPSDPLAPQASAWLIQIYSILNDVMAADKETWLLVERYSGSEYAVDAMFRLASRYVAEGAREKASRALHRLAAETRFPKIQARAVYELAHQAFRNGEKDAALKYLTELYEKFPDTPILADGYYLNGDILRADGDFKSAIPFYRKVIENRPNSPLAMAAYGSIGDCLLAVASQDPASSRNELQSAMQAYKTLREQPGCPSAFEAMALYRTGRCLELLGQRTEASEQYRQVLYRFPAAAAKSHPVETVWCVRAAEALMDIAGKYPVRTTLRHARVALHWLADAGMIPLNEASERFEKLKNNQFNP